MAQELNLYSDPRFFAAMQVARMTSRRTRIGNAVIDLITKNYSATLSEFTRIAQVRFTSADPRMSAQIANAFATEFIQANCSADLTALRMRGALYSNSWIKRAPALSNPDKISTIMRARLV